VNREPQSERPLDIPAGLKATQNRGLAEVLQRHYDTGARGVAGDAPNVAWPRSCCPTGLQQHYSQIIMNWEHAYCG
jgi:hypothetical protein